jgi:hypothetical protein
MLSTGADGAVCDGTANLPANLGYADAKMHSLKTKLVRRIRQQIKACALTLVQRPFSRASAKLDVYRSWGGPL